jgi:hypothetical protein
MVVRTETLERNALNRTLNFQKNEALSFCHPEQKTRDGELRGNELMARGEAFY